MATQPLLARDPQSGERSTWLHKLRLLGVPIVGKGQYGYITPCLLKVPIVGRGPYGYRTRAFLGSPLRGENNMAKVPMPAIKVGGEDGRRAQRTGHRARDRGHSAKRHRAQCKRHSTQSKGHRAQGTGRTAQGTGHSAMGTGRSADTLFLALISLLQHSLHLYVLLPLSSSSPYPMHRALCPLRCAL